MSTKEKEIDVLREKLAMAKMGLKSYADNLNDGGYYARVLLRDLDRELYVIPRYAVPKVE